MRDGGNYGQAAQDCDRPQREQQDASPAGPPLGFPQGPAGEHETGLGSAMVDYDCGDAYTAAWLPRYAILTVAA